GGHAWLRVVEDLVELAFRQVAGRAMRSVGLHHHRDGIAIDTDRQVLRAAVTASGERDEGQCAGRKQQSTHHRGSILWIVSWNHGRNKGSCRGKSLPDWRDGSPALASGEASVAKLADAQDLGSCPE